MRTFLILFISIALLTSLASAELMLTANTIGQGKWAVLGAGLQDSNASNNSDYTMTTLGGYVGYGLTDQTDLIINAGLANMGGMPSGYESSGTVYGATLKYGLLSEGVNSPVSIALSAGYKVISVKVKAPAPIGESTADGSQASAAVGISKIIVPFIPYSGIVYRSTSSDGSETATQIDATIGSSIAWSTQGAFFVEYTLQSIKPTSGSEYSSGQIGVGVGYTL